MSAASQPPVDLWITQAGYPQLHRPNIRSSEAIKNVAIDRIPLGLACSQLDDKITPAFSMPAQREARFILLI
jgi:hypothetical protein